MFISRDKMNQDKIFSGRNFIWNKCLLRSVSLWPHQRPLEKYFTRAIMMFSYYTMSLPVIIRGIEEIFEENMDVQILIENIAGFVCYLAIFLKYHASLLLERKFWILYEEIMRDWDEITNEDARKVLNRFANEGRRLTILYAVYMYGCLGPYVSLPSIIPMVLNYVSGNNTYEKELLHYGEYFLDEKEYFVYLYLHSLICSIPLVTLTIGIDTTFVVCAQHLIGLLHIIDEKFKNVSKMDFEKSGKKLKNNESIIRQEIIICIKIHQRAMELAEIIQNSYGYCFFSVAVCIVALFSTLTVNLLRNFNNPMRLYKILILWVANLVHLFYINWPGQKLIDACNGVFFSIYCCNWHQFSPQTKILLHIMLMRAGKLLLFTAGPLLVMNFECCGRLLRVAFTYFSVVAAVSE